MVSKVARRAVRLVLERPTPFDVRLHRKTYGLIWRVTSIETRMKPRWPRENELKLVRADLPRSREYTIEVLCHYWVKNAIR